MNKKSGALKRSIKWATLALVFLFALFPIFDSGRSEPVKNSGKGDLAELVKGNNAFAFDLYAKLKDSPGNIVFSPYSISSALAMAYAGARGETEKQMAQVLHFTLDQDRLHAAMAKLTDGLNRRGGSGKYELVVANRLWGQKGVKFLPSFLYLLKKRYGGGFETVDFASDPEKARHIINAWADEQTRGKIKEPVPPGAITPDTMLTLANAIYFKGKWENPFYKSETKDEPFFLSTVNNVDVPMMSQEEDVNWGEPDGYQFITLPYVGDELVMIIIVPQNAKRLASLEKNFSTERLESILASGQVQKVEIHVPRFKMNFDVELSGLLQKMGMANAFDAAADFSGMTGSHRFFISNAMHEAMVDVNEEGTEAAAVFPAFVSVGGATLGPRKIFRADHPFLFLIRDNSTGSILFMGRVMDPRG